MFPVSFGLLGWVGLWFQASVWVDHWWLTSNKWLVENWRWGPPKRRAPHEVSSMFHHSKPRPQNRHRKWRCLCNTRRESCSNCNINGIDRSPLRGLGKVLLYPCRLNERALPSKFVVVLRGTRQLGAARTGRVPNCIQTIGKMFFQFQCSPQHALPNRKNTWYNKSQCSALIWCAIMWLYRFSEDRNSKIICDWGPYLTFAWNSPHT